MPTVLMDRSAMEKNNASMASVLLVQRHVDPCHCATKILSRVVRPGFKSMSHVHVCSGPSCGNGVLEDGEQCDDGNMQPGDGCNAACQIEAGKPVAAALFSWLTVTSAGICPPCLPGLNFCGWFTSFATDSFTEANNNCKSQGGLLVSIHSAGEQQAVAAVAQGESMWIGLRDTLREGRTRLIPTKRY